MAETRKGKRQTPARENGGDTEAPPTRLCRQGVLFLTRSCREVTVVLWVGTSGAKQLAFSTPDSGTLVGGARERLPRRCCHCRGSDSFSILAVFSLLSEFFVYSFWLAFLCCLSPPLGVCNFTRSLDVAGLTSRFQLHSCPALSGNLTRLDCLLANRPTDPQRNNYPCCGNCLKIVCLSSPNRNDNQKCPYILLKRSQTALPVINHLHLHKSSLFTQHIFHA